MTDEDIDYIERELEIKLPESYRRALVPFRIPAMYSSTETTLGPAAGLVRLTRRMRAGSRYCPLATLYVRRRRPAWDEMIRRGHSRPEGPVWA